MFRNETPQLNDEASLVERAKASILSDAQYSETDFAKSEKERVYKYEVIGGGKSVLYFGTDHISDPQDPLFEEIESEIRDYAPEMLMVEGMGAINSRKESIKPRIASLSYEEAKKQGESTLVLKLAVELDVDFESPEPDLSEEVAYVEKSGFSRADIFSYYIYRIVEQYQRENKDRNLEDFKKYVNPFLKELLNESAWSADEFAGYENAFFAELRLEDHEWYFNRVHPLPDEGGGWKYGTNAVSSCSGNFRDQYALERIAESLQKYNKVFVAFGSAHAVRLEPALRVLLENK
ncbi:MAG: hypothetical protein WCO79_01030 [bacterium]